jgi:hypothetical protein
MLASRHRATVAGTFRDSQAVARREQRQESRTTQWDPARDDSVLDPALCWCSPKGRGDRLKIGTVGVRIPPPAPALRGLRLSPRAVSRRRLHQSNAKDLPSPDLSQRRPASRHRRSVSSDRAAHAQTRRARSTRPMPDRHRVLGRVAVDVPTARSRQEAFTKDCARAVAREARRGAPGSVRTRLHPFRRLSASAHRQRQELSGIRIVQSVVGHSRALRVDVSAAQEDIAHLTP